MSGLGQSPMALLSHDSNTGGGSNHSSAGTGVGPSPEKPVTTPRTPTERKRKRKTNASGPSLQGEYSCLSNSRGGVGKGVKSVKKNQRGSGEFCKRLMNEEEGICGC